MPSGVSAKPRRSASGQGPAGQTAGLEGSCLEIEHVYAGVVAQIDELALLVVEQKFVEARIGVDLHALEILKAVRRGCGAVRRG